jgi:hypothetical protein
MVLAQRARDIQLALRMQQGDAGDGTVLITGAGHARSDRGVPPLLQKDAPERTVLSVGLLEVIAGADSAEGYRRRYGEGPLPFDFVIFTPGEPREDPCEQFRRAHPPAPEKKDPSTIEL